MEFRVLAIGDVTSEEGTAHLRRHLPGFKKMKGVDFTVINGENISGTGLTPQQADDLFAAGADVITLGNHEFDYGMARAKAVLQHFEGLTVAKAQKAEVDGVSGATFSSNALTKNVKLGLEYYKKNKK